tara:strand:+ start:898 stop:1095 length:198 start_codon:yes stop_codon:yes gene_type:complete
MNPKDILNNIFNKNCRIVSSEYNNKKYINNLNQDLYKVECSGYIKRSDVINFNKDSKMSELYIID